MKNFYFTFGTCIKQPFRGGWIIVKADHINDAIKIFNLYFPNNLRPDQINCADVYSEEDFKNTRMYKYGNFGCRCHGIIGYKALKNKGESFNEKSAKSMP